MGTLIGHVGPGFGFFAIGLWHLYNHLRLLALKGPTHYKSLPWFPSKFLTRHLELYLIMAGTAASVAMELFIGPNRHQPLDPDGTIPSNHLHNFEHSSISLTFFVYALFALIVDLLSGRSGSTAGPIPARYNHDDVVQLVGAVAFAQQFLMFHLHSTDHMGVEGQYHWLLQLIVFVSLLSTLLGIGQNNHINNNNNNNNATSTSTSFIIAFVRSLSVVYQGVWLMVMGFALWTPGLIAKGCFMNLEEGHQVVRCDGEASLHRAKALVNIQFSWFLILLVIFATSFYVIMMRVYGKEDKVDYVSLIEDEEDVEAQKIGEKLSETQSFVNGTAGGNKNNKAIDHMER